MRNSTVLLAVASTLLLAACGGNTVSEEESDESWNATQQALSSGSARAQAEGSASVEDDGSSADTNVDYTCPQGGSATFDGSYSINSDDKVGQFDFSVQFEECESDDIVIQGPLDYSMTVEGGSDSGSVEFTYTGNLRYSGDVNGRCKIDMTGSSSYDASEESFAYSQNYSGTICGHDASSTLETDASADTDVTF